VQTGHTHDMPDHEGGFSSAATASIIRHFKPMTRLDDSPGNAARAAVTDPCDLNPLDGAADCPVAFPDANGFPLPAPEAAEENNP